MNSKKVINMNICMFVREYPSSLNEPIVSGEIKNPFYLTQILKEMGHKIVIITYNENVEEKECNGVHIYSIGKGQFKGVFRSITTGLNATKYFLKLVKNKWDFDIIHAHVSVFGLNLLKKDGKLDIPPIITTAHGTLLLEAKADIENILSIRSNLLKFNAVFQYYVDRLFWLYSDKVISAGEFQVKEMVDIYKLPKEKIIPLPNGVDTSFYKPSFKVGRKVREKYGIEDRKIVLFVGRLARKKGLQYLINSAPLILKEVPDTIFLVVGGTNKFAQYELELRKKIDNLKLRDNFIIVKNVPEKEMPAYYNAADVCVFPSVDYEPLPTVVFEAMACGKPVVATNLDGIPEQLGYVDTLVPQKDSKALAKKVIEVLKDDNLSYMLSKTNRKRSKKFDWINIVKKHIEIYKNMQDVGVEVKYEG